MSPEYSISCQFVCTIPNRTEIGIYRETDNLSTTQTIHDGYRMLFVSSCYARQDIARYEWMLGVNQWGAQFVFRWFDVHAIVLEHSDISKTDF